MNNNKQCKYLLPCCISDGHNFLHTPYIDPHIRNDASFMNGVKYSIVCTLTKMECVFHRIILWLSYVSSLFMDFEMQ